PSCQVCSWPYWRDGGRRRSRTAGRSPHRPGSNSMVPTAAVLPTLKTWTIPVRTPASIMAWATPSVRSGMSPWPVVDTVSCFWWTIASPPHASPASVTIKGTPWRGVLAFQRAEVSMFKKILLPLDLTDRHTAALRLAADLARQGDGDITLL